MYVPSDNTYAVPIIDFRDFFYKYPRLYRIFNDKHSKLYRLIVVATPYLLV